MPEEFSTLRMANAHAPIVLRRHEEDVDASTITHLLHRLDRERGMFYGSDYEHAPLFSHARHAFVSPALSITLQGGQVCLRPFSDAGWRIVHYWATCWTGEWINNAYVPTLLDLPPSGTAHHPTACFLRHLLADLGGDTRDLALYGAWNAQHWQLAAGSNAPVTGVKAVLYLPLTVLIDHGGHVRRIHFALDEDDTHEASNLKPYDASTSSLMPDAAPDPVVEPVDDFLPGEFARRIQPVIDRLVRGEAISVVLSQGMRRSFRGSPAAAFETLRQRYPMPEMYFVNFGNGEIILGASPCMQARLQGDRLDIAPVCGTSPRGKDALDDAQLTMALMRSDKETAALTVGTDAHLERLYQLCEADSVELVSHHRPHHFASLIHTMSHVRGRLRPGFDWLDVLLGTSSTATAHGVSRGAALALIAACEASPRGWYTGSAGRIGVDGNMQLGTILRSAWLRDSVVEVRTGSLLVADSDPHLEEEETRVKATSLLNILTQSRASSAGGALQAAATVPGLPQSVHLQAAGDPLEASLRAALQRYSVGVVEADAGARSREMTPHIIAALAPDAVAWPITGQQPLLLLGGAAERALLDLGGIGVYRDVSCFGHPVMVKPCGALVAVLGSQTPFSAGLYTTMRFDVAAMPESIEVLATDEHDAVLAFRCRARTLIGLGFRPESLLGGSHGPEILARALAWLVHTTRQVSRQTVQDRN